MSSISEARTALRLSHHDRAAIDTIAIALSAPHRRPASASEAIRAAIAVAAAMVVATGTLPIAATAG